MPSAAPGVGGFVLVEKVAVTEFMRGLKLSEAFYFEAVKPVLDEDFPELRYAATLIGPGSEVLGFDTAISTDHHWGPRLMLFLPEGGFEQSKREISEVLSAKLPYTFRGFSTNFGKPDEIGVRLMREIDSGPVDHMVQILTVRSFFLEYLGYDPDRDISVVDWLTFPEHPLRAATGGKVFHDGVGELTRVRETLRYYPRDIWLYLMAAQWAKLSQEEAFMGRCGHVGDELGSRIIASRLVHHLMRLCFLMERKYAPYSKWFGSAFAQLESAPTLTPVLHKVLSSETWEEREVHSAEAYHIVAEKHNALGITEPMETAVSSYRGRPYRIIHADLFSEAIRRRIESEEVRRIDIQVGSVNQLVDYTDVLEPPLCRKLRVLYE